MTEPSTAGVSANPALCGARKILCAFQNEEEVEHEVKRALDLWRVDVVPDAFGALRHLNTSPPVHAWVLSYWLPDLPGARLCREIRKSDPHVPICFYACEGSNHVIERGRALRAGADAFVVKEAGADALREELQLLLHKAELSNQGARAKAEATIGAELDARALALEKADHIRGDPTAAIARATRLRAVNVFLKYRGSLAAFEAWWPAAFDSAYRAHPVSRQVAVR